jgi:hypothetical protein
MRSWFAEKRSEVNAAPAMANGRPGGSRLLEWQRQVAMVGSDSHQDVLGRYLADPGSVVRLHATLTPGRISRGEHVGQHCVHVSLDGDRVGRLGRVDSEAYLPLVQQHAERGQEVVCGAVLTRGSMLVRVALGLPEPGDHLLTKNRRWRLDRRTGGGDRRREGSDRRALE